MLLHRLRRGPNIETAPDQCVLPAGIECDICRGYNGRQRTKALFTDETLVFLK